MREVYELRIWEEYASLLFRPDEFSTTGLSRRALIDSDDPRLAEVEKLQRDLSIRLGKSLFSSWDIFRRYSNKELDESNWFKLRIRSVFEPAGEECGTIYNESTACPVCQSGAKQVSPLYLPTNRIPKSKDISETIAGEMVVSRRLVEAFRRHGITGVDFQPIRSQSESADASEDWFQLLVSTNDLLVVPPTRTGIKPFDEDAKAEYKCVRGDLIGLNLLSEVSLSRETFSDLDVQASCQFIGTRSGLLRPQRIIILSQRVRKVLQGDGLKGAELEIAHAV